MSEDLDASESPADRAGYAERYRKIFEHSHDAIMVVDIENEAFLEVNPAASELLGYSRDELRSMHPADIHPEDIDQLREEFITQVVENGVGFTDDMTCLTKDGEEVPTEISGAALDSDTDEGESTQMIAILRDVSERVERERQLQDRIERLNRFANIVSHDLRSPLNVIKGNAELLAENSDDDRTEAIVDAAARMDELLTRLLDLARAGETIGKRTTVAIQTLARDVWTDVAPETATLDVRSSCTVAADETRLREAFENLFENALDHAGPAVTATVGTLADEERAGFYVEDDGPGIPESEREAVLTWGHTTDTDGSGFGLPITAEIIRAHGWTLTVTDGTAGGVRFEITGL